MSRVTRAGNRAGVMPVHKYIRFEPVALPDRTWPARAIEHAPRWCSVDLRDGNQALVEPMGPARKRRLFDALVAAGFAEIEVGFPSASQTEFDFLRELVETDRVPDDVTIQVLTQARRDLIERTFEALRGSRSAIVHLYNSTSELQRRVVFRMDRSGIVDLAVRAAEWVRERAQRLERDGTQVLFEYSPESFTGTELDFAVEICEAVMDVFEPTPERPLILNLPATVEMASPNVYADQIEWFGRNISRRDAVVLSVHPHNDRGSAVAAAELALLAGADRVEGTLFGNGERTGNVDIVTLAMNMVSQGIDPQLDFSDLGAIVQLAEHCTRLPVGARHPYAGELVFTAFSGSHQDAIRKGLEARGSEPHWQVPYLPIDPGDVGRAYEPVIRINSQSGKGGLAFVLEHDHGLRIPRRMQVEFSRVVQELTDESESEVSSEEVGRLFEREYLLADEPLRYVDHSISEAEGHDAPRALTAVLREGARDRTIHGYGNGPIDAFVDALRRDCGLQLRVSDYSEHATGEGEDATAVAYVEVVPPDGAAVFGAGRDLNIVAASLKAVVSAVNRAGARVRGVSAA